MRTRNSFINIITGITLQLTMILLNIVSRKIFIQNMNVEILGINGVLTNIISMLGLAELGIGSAISFSLYKPLADKNYEEVNSIMNLFSKFYRRIAIIILILGIILMPILKFIINTEYSNLYVVIIFAIFLFDSVVSYFLAYRRNILIADQKNHLINKIAIVFSTILTLIQIIIIIKYKNYILYLCTKVIFTLLQNIYIYNLTNKKYVFLINKNVSQLDLKIKKQIIQNIKALFLANISVYCIFGTDNLLIAAFSNVTIVAIYSNYTMIVNAVKGLISQVFLSITPSFGNLRCNKDEEYLHNIFESLHFINFWLSTVSASALFTLLNPFIKIWLNREDMIFSVFIVGVIVFNFYSDTIRSAIELVKSASGLYNPYKFFKYWIVLEAIINLVLSILLAGYYNLGILGVLLGTSISLMIPTYVLPWNVYKYVFKRSSREYYIKYIIYLITSFAIVFISYKVCNIINISTNIIINFIVKCFICLSISNIIIILLFRNSSELKFLLKRFMKYKK